MTRPLQIDAAPVVVAPTPVPTLGAAGLVVLSAIMAIFGLVRRRKPMA
ncbi:IPTL-CTERM sorting domain-containing protein [Comamonas piscis]